MLALSGICWFLVLSKSTRQKMPIPWWVKAISSDRAEQRTIADVLLLVLALLMALVFSLVSIAGLVAAVSRY